ncbi:trifunctional histidinol dehydrogenase/phosphoribosyl-AMP cyclohydrolase/phosphoribosyl-ATP diphosphatase [Saccharomycopsis crataegensis]|uniref:Histidine biosynthesis trifunctional protein n=1 Tax=Saccharomycopsis crataegensis TaxID=43959 RepID=A0AAV5QXK7_9ASCO|nr:trifunctional histidinol dehydrogenase/phosphoribosyl-AMP cyclohydrolase/phosphoribosyl-ATP diphosphatase [Saccharomycopsis crataegensis]
MVFPLLPSFGSIEDPQLPSLAITGNILLPYSKSINYKQFINTFASPAAISVDIHDSSLETSEIVDILNSGVTRVIVDLQTAKDLQEFGVPESRIIVASNDVQSTFKNYLVDASTYNPESFSKQSQVFVDYRNSAVSKDTVIEASQEIIPIIKSENLTSDYTNANASVISIADFLLPVLVTDRQDGLFTSMVTDIHNHSLGLVYSSTNSIEEAIKNQAGVYQSRKRGLWFKGATSGATQKLLKIDIDCDGDVLKFVVEQTGVGFCHLETDTCFGNLSGISKLQAILEDRKANAPEGSYTKRLFNDEQLLNAKIKEEAEELTEATTKQEIAWEAADLIYFALTRCTKYGVSIADIEKNLDLKHLKVTRRKGDAKPKFLPQQPSEEKPQQQQQQQQQPSEEKSESGDIHLKVYDVADYSVAQVAKIIERPVQSTSNIMKLVNPIIENVIKNGDKALLELTEKFDKVKLSSPIIRAPFAPELYQLPKDIKDALDLSMENVHKFHVAQLQKETMEVETSPGVICSRFSRPIEKVGLYIPGGTAVLPSTALMLGVPAKAAGCREIILASPPRKDGTLTPEVVYVAHKIGAKAIVLAGGAQAVAAMAYGTESVPKVDKIMGPGNQFVTAAKMYVSNDTNALCAIDMPAGPSEVLVIADSSADPDFVAADLLSQAEHGVDSQVILISIDLSEEEIMKIQEAVDRQARQLPREAIIRKCIEHSMILNVKNVEDAFKYSNLYAPEHLILQIKNANQYIDLVDNAGSVFVGYLTPESCGDYSSGTNHTLPTYGYARMYSGVNTSTFLKFITSQEINNTGLKNIGPAVMSVAAVEGLDAHKNAVKIRMEKLGLL